MKRALIRAMSGLIFGVCASGHGTMAQETPATGSQGAADAQPKAAPVTKNRKPFESLMFTTDEYNEIRGRIASGGETDTNAGRQAIEDATLYLSTIVYYGPKNWIIWVNNVPVGPDQEFRSFQVTEINPNFVELLVPLSAQGMRPVRLAPNQTLVTKTGAVVEGRIK